MRHSQRRTRPPPVRPIQYQMVSLPSETRRAQMSPKLSPAGIDRLRRFGTVRRYRARELLYRTGEMSPGMFVIISGTVALTRREGLGRVVPLVDLGPGDFTAEVGQL